MAYTPNHLRSTLAARVYRHDPADATVATKLAWVPMGAHFMALLTVMTGAVATFKIFAAVDGSGTTPTEVVAHATPTTADAVGDQLVLETDAASVLAVLPRASHVAVEVDMGSAADVAAVAYVMTPLKAQSGLTADVIS